MLDHYTSIPAMMSILRDAETIGEMCFCEIIQNVLHMNPDALMQAIQQEKTRQRDGKNIFYRECHLPISLLRAVYTRPEQQTQKFQYVSFCKEKYRFVSSTYNQLR